MDSGHGDDGLVPLPHPDPPPPVLHPHQHLLHVAQRVGGAAAAATALCHRQVQHCPGGHKDHQHRVEVVV